MIDHNDPRGTVGLAEDGEVQIRFRRWLPCPPDVVWDSLVTPERQQAWMPGCSFEPRVGGVVLFDFGDDGRAEGEVLVVDPPSALEHTWLWPGEPPSTVRYELTAVDDGTLLVLTHRPVGEGAAVDYCTGWHVMLDALGEHLAGRDPNAQEPDFVGLYELYAARSTGDVGTGPA